MKAGSLRAMLPVLRPAAWLLLRGLCATLRSKRCGVAGGALPGCSCAARRSWRPAAQMASASASAWRAWRALGRGGAKAGGPTRDGDDGRRGDAGRGDAGAARRGHRQRSPSAGRTAAGGGALIGSLELLLDLLCRRAPPSGGLLPHVARLARRDRAARLALEQLLRLRPRRRRRLPRQLAPRAPVVVVGPGRPAEERLALRELVRRAARGVGHVRRLGRRGRRLRRRGRAGPVGLGGRAGRRAAGLAGLRLAYSIPRSRGEPSFETARPLKATSSTCGAAWNSCERRTFASSVSRCRSVWSARAR